MKCENCGKVFEKLLSAISRHNFCSQTCSAIINNQKYPKRGPGYKICRYCSTRFKGRKLYCSSQCAGNGRRGYSSEAALEIIKAFFKENNRVPSRREMSKISGFCYRAFGSWTDAIKQAGLTPNRSHENRMYKRTMTKAKDGHLCDSVSEAIIDNWLTDNKIKHKRDFPYPNSKHKADWAINNKKFIEYFGLAQDSPRYDRSIKEKQELCRKYKISLVAIYPKNLYPVNNLDKKLHTLTK